MTGLAAALASILLLAAIFKPVRWQDLLTDGCERLGLVFLALWVVS